MDMKENYSLWCLKISSYSSIYKYITYYINFMYVYGHFDCMYV